jgi:hypothetical protein
MGSLLTGLVTLAVLTGLVAYVGDYTAGRAAVIVLVAAGLIVALFAALGLAYVTVTAAGDALAWLIDRTGRAVRRTARAG